METGIKKKVELLAPAGDWESFLAAVENGADAVYLGGKLFNARQFAGNFEDEILGEAIQYAHLRGVQVYLTMNTLLLNSEMEEALRFVEQAYIMGIDAVIVQDLGLAGLIQRLLPELPLHASTQMTIYNAEGVQTLSKLGFKRVVLARELSLEEIKAIHEETTMELEVFGHGALCICYSGQCLMSSMIGGRSGNRGKCAQPCRLPYDLVTNSGQKVHSKEKGRYLLSPKDLCSINEQQALIEAGVSSIKIEGRMKGPEYVAKVVGTYRKYLDLALERDPKGSQVDPRDLKDLGQIFNRGGLYSGYLKGKSGIHMMSVQKPKNWGIYLGEVISSNAYTKTVTLRLEEEIALGDGVEVWNGADESPGTVISEIKVNGKRVTSERKGQIVEIGTLQGQIKAGNKVYKTSDKELNRKARESFAGKNLRKTMLYGEMVVKAGHLPWFKVTNETGRTVEVQGETPPQEAIHKPLSRERVEEQLRKTGGTPFEFSQMMIELEAGLSLPMSEINSLRRRALEEMEQLSMAENQRKLPSKYDETKSNLFYFPGNSRKCSKESLISVFLQQIPDGLDLNQLGVERIYFPIGAFLNENSPVLQPDSSKVFAWVPAITRGHYDQMLREQIDRILNNGVDGFLLGNVGALWIKERFPSKEMIGDFSLNVFNRYAMDEFARQGIGGVNLSVELNLGQIGNLNFSGETQIETTVYGRLPLMTTEYCPVGAVEGGYGEKAKCSMPCQKETYKLRDRMGMEFPVYCDKIDCRSTIYNANVVFTLDVLNKIKGAGIDVFRLNFTDENPEEIMEIVGAYKDVLENGTQGIIRHKTLIEKMKVKGYTKGHFFRGV